jgi:8-oxo-dGTP diphosphatase
VPENLRIRQAVRAVVIDTDDRVLLVHFDWPDESVWAMPGGGIDPGESAGHALRRELSEETGLTDPVIGPAIWTRTHIFPFLDGSHDGQAEVYHLVRTEPFEPEPTWSWEELNREHVTDIRWWTLNQLHAATATFAPRRLPNLVRRLVTDGPPPDPIDVGV